MRITGYLMALLAAFAAGLGWMLRRREVDSVFDPVTGLAERGEGVTLALILLSVLTVALLFGLSFAVPKRKMSSFQDAFHGGASGAVFLVALGFLVLAMAGIEAVGSLAERDSLPPFYALRLGAALLAGIALVGMAILGPRGANVAIFSALPVFWICIWLIVSHIVWASNPVLLSYVYNLFALAALLLAFYYIAGYAFRQNRAGRLMFTSSTALYFTGVTMGDNLAPYTQGTLLVLAATALAYQLMLTKNLARPARRAIPKTNLDPDTFGREDLDE